MHLRGLALLTLFLRGTARRNFRIDDSRRDAQQHNKLLTKHVKETAVAGEAFLPWGLPTALVPQRGPQAGDSKAAHGQVSQLSDPHGLPARRPPGPRRATVSLQGPGPDTTRTAAEAKLEGILEANRRSALRGAAAAVLLAGPLAALADTQPELDAPVEGFNVDESRRAQFAEKNKKYKKAWRRTLSELEFAENDGEALEAVQALGKLIKENGFQIPEGVRKQDLDQVYLMVKPKLGKDARMEFLKLDDLVKQIVTVKKMDTDDPFSFN